MSRWRPLILLGLSASLCAAESPRLTLVQALDATQGANVNVLLGREAVAQAVEFSRQVRVGVMPNVALSAQQRRTQTVNITNGTVNSGNPANRFDGKLTGSYAVLNPTLLSATQSARAGVAVAEADLQTTLQLVMTAVAQTYFTHLRNLSRIEVLDANIARAQYLLGLAHTQLVANGTQIDVTRAEAQLALTQQARLQQDTVVLQSALQLQRLLDLDANTPLQLEGFKVRRAAAGAVGAAAGGPLFEQRTDWQRATRALEQARIDVRTARFERLPTLLINGEYGYAGARLDSNQKDAWFLGAGISLPVFDGLKGNADRHVALSRQRGQEVRLHNVEQQISAELRLATQDANSRFAQIAVAEKSLRLAEEQLRLARIRFEQGAADNREIIEAQNALAIASDGLVEAVYQYNLSRVEFARAKGDVRRILAEKAE